jgi:hypothetical protein
MRSNNHHVSLLFRMGARFLNHELAGSGISSGTAPLLLELRASGERAPVALAAAGRVEDAMRTWVAIVSQGVSPANLDTVNAVFDQFYANAQEYFSTSQDKGIESPLSRYAVT